MEILSVCSKRVCNTLLIHVNGLVVHFNVSLEHWQHVLEGVRAAAQLTHPRYESGTLTKYVKIVENYLTLAQGMCCVFASGCFYFCACN